MKPIEVLIQLAILKYWSDEFVSENGFWNIWNVNLHIIGIKIYAINEYEWIVTDDRRQTSV